MLILVMSLNQNINAQEEFILRIDKSKSLKGLLIGKIEFDKIKSELEILASDPYKNSITRIYNKNNQSSIFEFYNGCAIQFDKIIQKEDLANIEFNRILFSNQENEITYIINIESSFQESLESEIESKIELEVLDFFGEFYKLKNGNVLAKWSKTFKPDQFAILKDIRAMASISPELLSYIDSDKSKSFIKIEELIESIEYEPINFGVDSKDSILEIRNRISNLLNFDKSLLDFSLMSIDILENAMIWNCDKVSKYELFDLCYPYIGEIARRRNNLNWIKEGNDMILVDNEFNRLDFGNNLQRGITQSDYYPTIKWTIEQLEADLKEK